MIDSAQTDVGAVTRQSHRYNITPRDNNVTHRNYHNLSDTRSSEARGFLVRNPTDVSIEAVLRLESPDGWQVELDRFGFDEPFVLSRTKKCSLPL